jgi:glycosyltransferase involved in cell wall biosynthesis
LEVLALPEWKTRPWRLNLYGDGPMRQTLGRLAGKLDLSARVTFAGFVPADEIWATDHVLVMPSRYEGLPLAMVEAMLCGRPVIATDVAGHKEVVTDGVTGFLAEAPTVKCLSMALERFWQRRHEAAEMGAAGGRLIRQLMPSDPILDFSSKLKAAAGLTQIPSDGAGRHECPNRVQSQQVLPTEPQLPDRRGDHGRDRAHILDLKHRL